MNQYESLINIYFSSVENYLSKPAVEDANISYMTFANQNEINDNISHTNKDKDNNNANNKEIV